MGDWGYLILKIAITIVVILILTALVYWLVRRYSAIGLGGIGRGRVPRLAVVDALTVDRRRRLLLVRRDNVEHLILIGGPSDVVVETAIQRTRTRQAARAAASPPAAPGESPVVQELMQSGIGGAPPPGTPAEPSPEMRAAPQETTAGNLGRLVAAAERAAPIYRTDLRASGTVDARPLAEPIGEVRHEAPVPTPVTSAAPPPYGRDLRVVPTEPPAAASVPSAPDDDPAMTKISDLEQEMARLLGQLNVKRP
jgi:hypothetical protein